MGRLNILKKRVVAALFAAVILTLFMAAPFLSQANASIFDKFKSTNSAYAELSGFEPNAIVSYKITANSSDPLMASAITDQNGDLKINIPDEMSTANEEFKYDFTINQKEQTFSLELSLNTKTGEISFNGQGAKALSDIEVSTANNKFNTRTDWAGLFEETGLYSTIEDNKPVPVEIAFFNQNIASDAQDRSSPALVKVQAMPSILLGGGLEFFISQYYVRPMKLMAHQLSAVALYQMPIIGMFFDAKEQLETQRTHQMLKAEAVKDYHPSQQMCRIGSYMRSLPNAEKKAAHDHFAINDALMQASTNQRSMSTSLGRETDTSNRIQQFITTYCDPNDADAKIKEFCTHAAGTGAIDPSRVNKDVDYANNVELPLTMDIDFSNDDLTDDEIDVLALARNLYWTDAFRSVTGDDLEDNSRYYVQARQLMALANLSHNSFAKLVAMKARAPDAAPGVQPGWSHMKTMMREMFPIPPGGTAADRDDNIDAMVGENPSYYAQMDILTKKLYQNPNFYTNLYDKPTNVERINTSLEAIKLMQMRDHYEASLRREMLTSGLIGNSLVAKAEKIQGTLSTK